MATSMLMLESRHTLKTQKMPFWVRPGVHIAQYSAFRGSERQCKSGQTQEPSCFLAIFLCPSETAGCVWAELKSSKICKILLTMHLLLLLYQWNPIKSVKWKMTESHVWTAVLSWKVSNLGVWEHNNKMKTHTSLRIQNTQSLIARGPSTTMPMGAALTDLPAHTGWGG